MNEIHIWTYGQTTLKACTYNYNEALLPTRTLVDGPAYSHYSGDRSKDQRALRTKTENKTRKWIRVQIIHAIMTMIRHGPSDETRKIKDRREQNSEWNNKSRKTSRNDPLNNDNNNRLRNFFEKAEKSLIVKN